MRPIPFSYLILLGFALIGCLSKGENQTALTPTPTADTLATSIMVVSTPPTELPPLSVVHQVTASPVAAEATPTPCDETPASRPTYSLNASLNWAEHQVQVDQEIIYTNATGQALSEIVLHVEPNRQTGFFSLQSVMLDTNQLIEDFRLDLTRLTLPLPQALGINCQIILKMSYTVRIPPVLDGYEGRLGYWGYTERQMNLGHWLPVLAPFAESEWQVPRPHFLGEQITAETSDFEVTLNVANAPPNIAVAAPGVVRVMGQNVWQIVLKGGRDVAISIGAGFTHATKLAGDGTLVELYFYPDSAPPGLTPAQQALTSAGEALVLYEELFGTPYPFERLVIVEGDFPDGMEFSGLVFVGEAWFKTWSGKPNDWLTVITVHEVAHQWWYGLVGNNPARYPYLDEALATYSEYLYFQRYYGDLFDWWWDFRVRIYNISESVVDTDIYAYDNGRPYINGVYLKGAELLHTMRLDLGDEAFFAWLQGYMKAEEYQLATPQDLWGQLSPEQYAASLPVRQAYFQQPDVLPTPPPFED